MQGLAGRGFQLPMEKKRLGKAFLQEAQAIDYAAPAPALMGNFQDLDLQNVAGFRAYNKNRSGQGVDASAINLEEFAQAHGWMDLRAAGIQAIQMNGVTGGDAETRE